MKLIILVDNRQEEDRFSSFARLNNNSWTQHHRRIKLISFWKTRFHTYLQISAIYKITQLEKKLQR